ncbi:GumC family protein [Histidinibacterium lentulum]|uniref:Uncharacterized protein n=1 Tax=Histidinibacterium lentulum TaxID=2480588 RepID=A0A3N2QS11_9RHOB|nr:GNVR domain-containing protein [Histidinibacterium lentulum]ROT97998.1 hypothetical protein EAT49_17130 [Histidinibacterium lentulum]
MTEGWDNSADGGAQRTSAADGGGGPSLLALAWANKWLVGFCGGLAAVAAYAALSTVAPTYSARTQVLLEPATTTVIDAPAAAAAPRVTPAQAESTVIVMKSTEVLRAVAEELGLSERSEFNPALREPGLADRARSALRDAVSGLLSPAEPEEGVLRIAPGDPLAGVIRELRNATEIRVLGESAIIEVRSQSRSPALAAAISDAVAATYIEQELAKKFASGTEATTWLEERTEQLRAALLEADERVAAFRSEQLSEGAEAVSDLELRIEELTRQIARLDAELSDTLGRRDELRRLYEERNFLSLVPRFDIPSINAVYADLMAAEAELSDREARFGDLPVVEAQREVRDDVQARLESEVDSALSGLDVRVDILSQRLAASGEELRALRRDLVERQQAELRLAELEREAEASGQVYNRFLVQLKELRERSQFQIPDARIITEADVPVAPVAPQKAKLAVIAGLGASALALLLIALLRDNRPRVRDAEDLADLTGVDQVEQLPPPPGGSPLALLERVRARPESPEAQSLRWLRYRLRARKGRQAHVIFVTSARAEPGKSGLCVALAETFALGGASTVLVNIDGQAEDLAAIDSVKALRDMPFRYLDYTERTMRALNMGSTEAAGDLADRLRILKSTDVILINGPSVLRSADALEMGEMASRVLMVCTWNETPSALVQQGVSMLRGAGARVDAIAVNNVPRRWLKPAAHLPHPPQPRRALAAAQD